MQVAARGPLEGKTIEEAGLRHLPGMYVVEIERAGMVASVTLGWLEMLQAAMLTAGLMILTRCTTTRIARQAVDWQVLITIAASFGRGAALYKTGAAMALAAWFM